MMSFSGDHAALIGSVIVFPSHPKEKMQTFNTEGNELADQIIQERVSLQRLRFLLNVLDFRHKIAVAQIACNQISRTETGQLIKLLPFAGYFDDRLQAAINLMDLLPPETLAEIAIEILEEPRDQNE